MMFYGELFALLSAGLWSVCTYSFKDIMKIFPPMMFNFIKCLVASIAIFICLCAFNIDFFPVSDSMPYLLLAVSGICGIAFGDSFYLYSVNKIGPRKALLLETLAPPMTGLIAFMYYGTSISFIGWFGVSATLYGLYIVVTDQQNSQEQNSTNELLLQTELEVQKTGEFDNINEDSPEESPRESSKKNKQTQNDNELTVEFKKGLISGVIAMLLQSIGMVLSSGALLNNNFDSLLSTFIRIFASLFLLFPILKYWQKQTFYIPKLEKKQIATLLLGIIISTFICIWFQQLSLVYTRPEISQTLLATSPLFAIFISKYQGEVIPLRQYFGSFIAVCGVGLIVWS